MDKRIHIAYGFHVNCYHSYRGDTPDEKGFGSDIRVIRHILKRLDDLNAAGIPVKGTWDIENFFSLEKILPEYAPDIIDAIRRRTAENGDEQLIMGYTNGALGAMTNEELEASVSLSVTNPAGSGLKDLFGKCEMIVRPQEVMFSPPQVPVYNKIGVKALCLYDSCVPFDAFGTLIKPLSEEERYNPLTFTYKGEGLTVIPTCSNADVCDAGCLRALVKDLRRQQEDGRITKDLLIFINMDADAVFWESLDLPLVKNRLANTDGIRGLVSEVADLPYVVFDTPGAYLKTHAPVRAFTFGQDTADGNFTGYASWAEKPFNRTLWTGIERARVFERVFPDDGAFLERLRLLSTTHFGLATPVLNIAREQKAEALLESLSTHMTRTHGPLTVHTPAGVSAAAVQVSCKDPERLRFEGNGIGSYTVLPAADGAAVFFRFSDGKTEHVLTASFAEEAPSQIRVYRLESGDETAVFSVTGELLSLRVGGEELAGKGFLDSYLTYNGKKVPFGQPKVLPCPVFGGTGVRLAGEIHLPGETSPGTYRFDFFTSEAAPGIHVLTEVRYPYTPEGDAISTENSTLGRFTDNKWEEAAPFALTPSLSGDVLVHKRNFMPETGSFRVRSYAEANPENRTLASFNNQLTAGLVGLSDGKKGLLLINARTFLSSMAYCSMRLDGTGSVTMNPFGTFTGPQRKHFSRSGGKIPDTYTLIAPQGKSLAPAYNGAYERALFRLLPFAGKTPDAGTLSAALSLADGAVLSAGVVPFTGQNAVPHKNDGDVVRVKMRSPLLTGVKGNLWRYAVSGARALAYIIKRQRAAK